jgi:hypothetical protein
MIKNTTPYIGKLRLKFEKYPEYTGKDKLNKIHLDLGFTKLVSRITPYRDTSGWLINPQAKYLIDRHTGGMINNYAFGNTIQEKKEQQLPNSFLTKDGDYVGDIERGWWYYKNKMKVCDKYPHGVAEIYDDEDTEDHQDDRDSRIVDIEYEIQEIKDDPDGEPNEDSIEEAVEDYLENIERDPLGFLEDMGYTDFSDFLDLDEIKNDLVNQADYGETLNGYNGSYEEITINGTDYIVMRID